jgi:uncharacterized membrane protein
VAGTQNIVVTGTDATGTQTANYALTVTLPPTLSLSAAVSAVSMQQGASATVALSAVAGGSYSGAITYSIAGLPSGVTAKWSANPVTPATSVSTTSETLTLTAASTATAGTATVTITAAGDGLVASKSISLQVLAAPGIQLSEAPASVSMQSLSATTATVTATPVGGFVAAAAAAGSSISIASGLPKGVTAAWSKPTLTAAGTVTWTLTLTGSTSTAAGAYNLNLAATVAGKTGPAYSASGVLPLNITLTPPALVAALGSTSLTVTQGKAVTNTISLAGNGTYAGAITLSLTGLPAGVTAAWSANPLTLVGEAGSSTLTLTTATTTVVGSYPVTVTAIGDGLTVVGKFALQVQTAPGLLMALGATTINMVHTYSTAFSVSVSPVGGFNAPVALSVSGLPANVSASFSKATLAAPGSGSVTLTLGGSSLAKAGTSKVTVTATGTSGGVTYSAAQVITLNLQ